MGAHANRNTLRCRANRLLVDVVLEVCSGGAGVEAGATVESNLAVVANREAGGADNASVTLPLLANHLTASVGRVCDDSILDAKGGGIEAGTNAILWKC